MEIEVLMEVQEEEEVRVHKKVHKKAQAVGEETVLPEEIEVQSVVHQEVEVKVSGIVFVEQGHHEDPNRVDDDHSEVDA